MKNIVFPSLIFWSMQTLVPQLVFSDEPKRDHVSGVQRTTPADSSDSSDATESEESQSLDGLDRVWQLKLATEMPQKEAEIQARDLEREIERTVDEKERADKLFKLVALKYSKDLRDKGTFPDEKSLEKLRAGLEQDSKNPALSPRQKAFSRAGQQAVEAEIERRLREPIEQKLGPIIGKQELPNGGIKYLTSSGKSVVRLEDPPSERLLDSSLMAAPALRGTINTTNELASVSGKVVAGFAKEAIVQTGQIISDYRNGRISGNQLPEVGERAFEDALLNGTTSAFSGSGTTKIDRAIEFSKGVKAAYEAGDSIRKGDYEAAAAKAATSWGGNPYSSRSKKR